MAKVKKFWESVPKESGGYAKIEGDLNINADGHFYFRVDEELRPYAEQMIQDRKDDGRDPKVWFGKTGKYENLMAREMAELESALKATCRLIAKSGTKKSLVLIYAIHNEVSFEKLPDGSIHPSREYMTSEQMEVAESYEGLKDQFGDRRKLFGVNVYAKVMVKIEQTGSTSVKLERPDAHDWPGFEEEFPWGAKLNEFELPWAEWRDWGGSASNRPRVQDMTEVEYTEERGKFFYDLMIGICKLADKFRVLEDNETVLKLADSGQALLPEPEQKGKKK